MYAGQARLTISAMTNKPVLSRTTPAYFFQTVASFVVSAGATCAGIAYLPVNAWERGFLALGLLYTITSSITLSKVIRDRQEESSIVAEVKQAQMTKILSEHNPYSVDSL